MQELLPQTVLNENSDIINHVFNLQKANQQKVNQSSSNERIAKLKKISKWILANKERIRAAHYLDFKKPPPEVDLQEIYVTKIEINKAIHQLKKWMGRHKVLPILQLINTQGWIQYEPKGLVLIISPWNFPFMLAVTPVVSAIAAGNCIVLKPSEISQNTSALINEMFNELFPENEVAVIIGGREITQLLLKKPFNHIYFTGSSAVGKINMKAAAENLASVTLELGGKNPVIIDETADLDDTAKKIVWGKFLNGGQTCVAPDYAYVHESICDKFFKIVTEKLEIAYKELKDNDKNNRNFTHIINDHHYSRLKMLYDDALKNGATTIAGGNFDSKDRYMAPTILSNVKIDSLLMQEEIFGPLLPVFQYQNINQVLEYLQGKEKPLALYVFSRSRKNVKYILRNTAAGGTCINDVVIQFFHLNLPFGGVNHSGFGKSHGFYGFKSFSNERGIIKSNRYNPLKFIYPPFNQFKLKLIKFMLKYL
jgi:aldehyde dehydrogenase (NAD+)